MMLRMWSIRGTTDSNTIHIIAKQFIQVTAEGHTAFSSYLDELFDNRKFTTTNKTLIG